MIPDTLITESRLRAFMEMPWPIPALVLMEISDEDLDNLGAISPEEYWGVLNAVVARIKNEEV